MCSRTGSPGRKASAPPVLCGSSTPAVSGRSLRAALELTEQGTRIADATGGGLTGHGRRAPGCVPTTGVLGADSTHQVTPAF